MIEASVLRSGDVPALARLWTQALAERGGDCGLSVQELKDRVLLHGGEPRAILAIDSKGWIVARSDGKLVGFAHCTVGRFPGDDPETLRGVLRSIILAPDAPEATSRILLRAADAYFRTKSDLANILAFPLEAGYPRLNSGRGALSHDQWLLMDALGQAGYRLAKRWLFYEQRFSGPIAEHLPQIPGLKMTWSDSGTEEFALQAWSGQTAIAFARFLELPQPNHCQRPRAALLYRLQVLPEFQRQGVGKWLLERGSNHLIARGVSRLLVDAPHEDSLFQSRLRRLGFYEQPQRGYAYEKPHA